MSERIKITRTEVLSHRFVKLSAMRLDYRRNDGTWQSFEREVHDHGHAAAILLHDPDRDTVLLVRQFRLPPYLNDGNGWLVEVCAGLLDGEAPETCARREAEEETGYRPKSVSFALKTLPSPGIMTETVHCFVGEYDPSCRIDDGGGLHHEGEDIEVLEIGFDKAIGMIATGEITDAKTILLLQHLALTRLRPQEPGHSRTPG